MMVQRLLAVAFLLHIEAGAGFTATRTPLVALRAASATTRLYSSSEENFYNDFEGFDDDGENDEEDSDGYIDSDNLGDWRKFRMNLAESGSPTDKKSGDSPRKSVSKENEEVLRSQSTVLADEYESGIWAHEAPAPEVGGLILRLPLEVEVYRNTKHSMLGKKLRKLVNEGDRVALWYRKAQLMCEQEMKKIAGMAENGQIDASDLDEESNEYLQMYLDNQETWQEVCLVLDRGESTGKATALVLNRPMAFKLTENLAQLVVQGALASSGIIEKSDAPPATMPQFMKAFGKECAVYVGGPDDQGEPATLIHGFKDLLGAKEVSPGCNIYMGGLPAAIQGVIDGKYQALDFRFFVGKHSFKDNRLDLDCILGKYQPVACARPLALKQCIALPKPLYHEVLELCGGELKMISQLELSKRDDLSIQFEVEDDEIRDELDELNNFDEDDDEDDSTL